MKKIAVIGAGIAGTTTAYALLKRGHKVTIFDYRRYPAMATSYANGGQLSASNAEWMHCEGMTDGVCDGMHEESGMNMWLGAGCSKVLGLDGHLWFEPHVGVTMPAESDQMIVGLGMGFRFAF